MAKRMNKESFIEKAHEVHGDKYDYSKVIFKYAKEPVEIICPKHGSFWQRPQDHYLKGCGCPKCKGEKVIQVHSYKKEDWIKLVTEKYKNKYDYSKVDYIDYNTPVIIICPIHGEFKCTPNNHYKSITGCPKCGREKANKTESSSQEYFIEKAKQIHNNRYDYSKVKYISQQYKITIICPEHGEFEQLPGNHLTGQGCPKCAHLKSQVKLYEQLKETFLNEEILFEVNKETIPWLERQRLDIYFPKYNIAIEYNGIQHYIPVEYFGGKIKFEQQQNYDELKRQKCKENNCYLFEVKYNYTKDDYNNLINNIQNIIEKMNKVTKHTQDNTGLIDKIQNQ